MTPESFAVLESVAPYRINEGMFNDMSHIRLFH